ncbi:MAG: hypothetical protein KAU38_08665 [Desulfobacterales bacterium]|nr:hypothetical protein [Desulfobacterales bacterium]
MRKQQKERGQRKGSNLRLTLASRDKKGGVGAENAWQAFILKLKETAMKVADPKAKKLTVCNRYL